jgi:hypothetical protein
MKQVFLIMITLMFGIYYCPAQVITSNKTITTKIVPLQYKDRTDTLYIPVISDRLPQLKKVLSEKEILNGENLQDVINEYAECGCGITSLNYNVVCFDRDILSINLMYETMGAYPSSGQRWLTLNPSTGKSVLLSKILNSKGLRFVKADYKRIVNRRIKNDRMSLKDDPDYSNVYPKLLTSVNTFEIDSPETKYLVTEKGILLSSNDVLPHVIQSFEPNRAVLFSYKQLMKLKYLDPKGLLGKSNSH